MIKKAGNVIQVKLSDTDSNIYLLGDTAIDSGTGLNFTRLRDFLKVAKVELKDIRQVVNTHGHYDHIGGNGYFYNAQIMVHEGDAEIVEKGDEDLAVVEFFDGSLKPHKVGRKLKHGDKIQAGGAELEVLHTPGHTEGSICLYDRKNKLLFTGDTVFENAIGRVDFENSDPAKMAESLKALEKLDVATAFPGHGEPFPGSQMKKVCKTVVADFQKRVEEGEVDEDYI